MIRILPCLPRSIPRNGSGTFIAIVMIVLTTIGVGVYLLASGKRTSEEGAPIMIAATRGEFVAQVLDQGEIQSSENIEIRCEVRPAGGSISAQDMIDAPMPLRNTIR